MDLFERYISGERREVWHYIVENVPADENHPEFEDALRVTDEIVGRAWTCLQAIYGRLVQLDYRFAHPEKALKKASTDTNVAIDALEYEVGQVPMILRRWYRVIESVDFSQQEDQIRLPRGAIVPKEAPPTRVHGLGCNNSLIIRSPREVLSFAEETREEVLASNSDREDAGYPLEEVRPFVPLGGVGTNNALTGFFVPACTFDASIQEEPAPQGYLVDTLRESLRYGGFPAYKRALRDPDYYIPMCYRPDFATVHPFLTEGLPAI